MQRIAEAIGVRELVLASPELSLNPYGKRKGRCRTQLCKLFRLSWLNPRGPPEGKISKSGGTVWCATQSLPKLIFRRPASSAARMGQQPVSPFHRLSVQADELSISLVSDHVLGDPQLRLWPSLACCERQVERRLAFAA